MKGMIVAYNAHGEFSKKQEITIALDEQESVIPVGRNVEIKILR